MSGSPLHRENRENGQKRFLSGKTQGMGNSAKPQGILFAQVVNSLIIKLKKIVLQKILIYFEGGCLPSQFCLCNSHKSDKLTQGKVVVR